MFLVDFFLMNLFLMIVNAGGNLITLSKLEVLVLGLLLGNLFLLCSVDETF